jgi:uncharacterized damage-inducible protein DinB
MNARLQERYDRLEATRREVLARLKGHDRARLNRPRPDGGWSVLQVLHHVVTAEAGTLGYVSKKMKGGTSLPRAGFVSRLRLLALQLGNASPLRFQAPAGAGDVPEEVDPAELLERWDEVRAGWKERLDGFPDELLDRTVFRHAMVGLMRLPHTLAFLQSHLDHHARQVERLLDA